MSTSAAVLGHTFDELLQQVVFSQLQRETLTQSLISSNAILKS